MPRLSVVIIAFNEEKNILRCIRSVQPVADEIVLVDSGSADSTIAIARETGCRIFERPFDGYGKQKQFAVEQAVNDWVFSLDADEVVSPELLTELQLLFQNRVKESSDSQSAEEKTFPHPGKQEEAVSSYTIPFSLCFMGKILKHSGTGREHHLRIFDRRLGHFTETPVHEGIVTRGKTKMLNGKIIHYSYRDIRHHLEKINTYTTQAAEGYIAQKRSFSRFWVALKFPVSFFTFYFIRLGILDGYQGFMWSFLAAFYGAVKIAKTIELNEQT